MLTVERIALTRYKFVPQLHYSTEPNVKLLTSLYLAQHESYNFKILVEEHYSFFLRYHFHVKIFCLMVKPFLLNELCRLNLIKMDYFVRLVWEVCR